MALDWMKSLMSYLTQVFLFSCKVMNRGYGQGNKKLVLILMKNPM